MILQRGQFVLCPIEYKDAIGQVKYMFKSGAAMIQFVSQPSAIMPFGHISIQTFTSADFHLLTDVSK
jgi:hypothetical protein